MNAGITGVFMLPVLFPATAGCRDKTGRVSPACSEGTPESSLNAGKMPVPAGKTGCRSFLRYGQYRTGRAMGRAANRRGYLPDHPGNPLYPGRFELPESRVAGCSGTKRSARPRIAGPVKDIRKQDTYSSLVPSGGKRPGLSGHCLNAMI